MAFKSIDFTDEYPMLSARGIVRVLKKREIGKGGKTEKTTFNGRYLDPVSGRLDLLSSDEYYLRPVNTRNHGRATDYLYDGQKEGNFEIEVIAFDEKEEEEDYMYTASPRKSTGWKEYKLWDQTVMDKDGPYTNIPAKY